MERIRIGSQLFINKDDRPDDVRRLVRSMKEHGLELIRLFMIWEQLEPAPGKWTYDLYDACFDEAEKWGLQIVPTLMSVSPPGWMRLTDGPQSVANLDDPDYLERSKTYIRNIVQRYKDRVSLDSWILWNEASRAIARNPHSLRAYVSYLQEKYKSIDRVNRLFYHQFDSFNDCLEAFSNQGSYSAPFKSYDEMLEWKLFSVDNLTRQLQFIRNEIRFLDPVHPIHVNPHNLSMDMQEEGQSIWRERDVTDFMGCSAHPMWHSVRFPSNRLGQSIAYFADLMRSCTPHPERKFWVTELQGGVTLYSAQRSMTPEKSTLRLWMWESIGAGAKAVVFWCYNSRNSGYEAGEWSLLNQLEETSPRLEAVMEVAGGLRRFDGIYTATAPAKPKVLLLYSESSWALGTMEGMNLAPEPKNPRNPNMYADALAGAYLMFSDLSIEVDFINEVLILEENRLKDVSVLVLPNVAALSQDLLDTICEFVVKGGMVITDGLTGYKNAAGHLNSALKLKLGDLFGAQVADILIRESFQITSLSTGSIDGWFYQLPLKPEGAMVTANHPDGSPAMTEHGVGKGKTLRIGTNLFQHYFASPDPSNLEALKQIMKPYMADEPVILTNSDHELRVRRLEHPDGYVLILFNYSAETRNAMLCFHLSGSWHNLTTAECGMITDKQTLEVNVPAGSSIQLFFRCNM